MADNNLFEPGSEIGGQRDAQASIAISLKRIADIMAGGSNKHAPTINGTLGDIARHLVHIIAKL